MNEAYRLGKLYAMEKEAVHPALAAMWQRLTMSPAAARATQWGSTQGARLAPYFPRIAGLFARSRAALPAVASFGARSAPLAQKAPSAWRQMAPWMALGLGQSLYGAREGRKQLAGFRRLGKEQEQERRVGEETAAGLMGQAVGREIEKANPLAKLLGSQRIGKTGPYWSPGLGAAGAVGGGLLGAGLGINPIVTALLLGGAGAFLGPKLDLTRWGGPAAAPSAAPAPTGGKI